MRTWLDTLMIFLVLSTLLLLGSSRLRACTWLVALQGMALGLLPLLLPAPAAETGLREWAVGAGSIALRGVAFPWLLLRAQRAADVRHEVEPFVGYTTSLLVGTLALGGALWVGSWLPLPEPTLSPLLVPVALFTALCGLFLIVSRRTALSQVLGYLVLENGIYTFGVGLARDVPLLVEMGVLLDVFVGLFVMGILIFHIRREFDHIDADQLSVLRDEA
jgi:hydrogenase-4 component E